jgi:hypothetical protein
MSLITNGKDLSFGQQASGLPNVIEAIQSLLQPLYVTYIQKQQVDGYTQEITISLCVQASIQPGEQKLDITPTGQRSWRYWDVWCENNLDLQPDEAFEVGGLRYRILSRNDWSAHGYIHYQVVEDYQTDDNV